MAPSYPEKIHIVTITMGKHAAEEEQMYPQRSMVSQALRVALLVTLVALAVCACGGGQEQAEKPRPLPEDEKALRPGVYRSEEFEPSLSFRVGKGWTNAPPESSEFLELQRGAMGGVLFLRIKEVYEPARMGVPNLAEAPKDPRDWVAWVRHHPYLRTSEPEQVEVGGVKGKRLDVVVGDLPEGHRGRCGTDCVDIGRVEGVPPLNIELLIHEEDKVRVTFLDVEGETVTISISSLTIEFGEFVPEAQKVIESVKWKGS